MKKIKIIIDVLMSVSLMLLMAYNLIGDVTHEIIGTIMMILFILHHILNRKWIKSVFKGKYTPYRIFQTFIAVFVFVSMIMQMVSGIVLSKYIFSFVNVAALTEVLRKVHLAAAYWGFVFMSMHIGIHFDMIINSAVRKLRNQAPIKKMLFDSPALLIALYGIYAFIRRNIAEYMFLKSQFVFFNFDELIILFFADYLAVMSLFAVIAYYLCKMIKRIKTKY